MTKKIELQRKFTYFVEEKVKILKKVIEIKIEELHVICIQ